VDRARLEELDFFAGLPERALDRLAASAHERDIDDRLLVRQHDEATTVHLLLSGSMSVLVRFEGFGDLFTGTLRKPGTLIGWSCFRAPYRYTASIRPEGPSRVLAVPRESFEALFADDPACGYEILKRVASTVDARLMGALDWLETPVDIDPGAGADA